MNFPTVIVLLVVLGLVVLAVMALRKGKSGGSCCDGKPTKTGCSGCSMDCPFRR